MNHLCPLRVINDGSVAVVNIGDGIVVDYATIELARLTKDHTVTADMVQTANWHHRERSMIRIATCPPTALHIRTKVASPQQHQYLLTIPKR